MSRGTTTYALRIPDELIREVERTIARRNVWTKEPPWSFSDFVRIAIAEKLAKMDRCRSGRAERRLVPVVQPKDQGQLNEAVEVEMKN